MSLYRDTPPKPAGTNFVILALLALVVGLGVIIYRLKNAPAPASPMTKAVVDDPAGGARGDAAPATATSPGVPPAAPAAADEKAPENPMAAMAAMASQMMNNPAMREMMAAQQKMMLEQEYAEILRRLEFTPEQRSRFLAMMSETQTGMMDLGMELMSGGPGSADRDEIKRQREEAEKAAEARLTAFFAAEFPGDFSKRAAFDEFVELRPIQEEVNQLQVRLLQSGQPLSAEQSTAYTAILREMSKDAGPAPEDLDLEDPAAMMDPKAIEKMLGTQEAMQKKVQDRAAAVLTPAQMSTLKAGHTSELEMMKMGLEMSRQMLGAPATR